MDSGDDRPTRPTVLVVDDDPAVTDLYAWWLREDYEVETAQSGDEAVERLDDGVDVALLDRRMPDLSGDQVLAELRRRDHDCQVAMVTAVKPTGDVLEMGFDDYLTKPVSKAQLLETVSTLLERRRYSDRLQDYFSLVSKRTALETEGEASADEASATLAELDDRIEDVEADVSARGQTFDREELRSVFRAIDAHDGRGG